LLKSQTYVIIQKCRSKVSLDSYAEKFLINSQSKYNRHFISWLLPHSNTIHTQRKNTDTNNIVILPTSSNSTYTVYILYHKLILPSISLLAYFKYTSGLESMRMRPTSSGWKTHGPTGQMGTVARGSTPGFSGRVHSKIAGTYKKKRRKEKTHKITWKYKKTQQLYKKNNRTIKREILHTAYVLHCISVIDIVCLVLVIRVSSLLHPLLIYIYISEWKKTLK